jgi:outer membrane protein assembly factor BamB
MTRPFKTNEIAAFRKVIRRTVISSIVSTLVFVGAVLIGGLQVLACQDERQEHAQWLLELLDQDRLRSNVVPVGFAQQAKQKPDEESGAVLKTDPDLEQSLATAERLKNDGNYRYATQVWQAVLQRSGDSLYSTDKVTYFSLVQQVEQILAELPREGLIAYRIVADAEAKEILAEAGDPNDLTALNKVVRQYFISSLGDDAAYQLGCIYLDRFDFTGARRMFEKIINHYPDPSVDKQQVLIRIALCQSYLADVEGARETLEQAKSLGSDSNQLEQVKRSLGELSSERSTSIVNASWEMPMGSSRRYGLMPSLPVGLMDGDLAAVWQFYYQPRDKYRWTDAKGHLLVGEQAADDEVAGTIEPTETRMIDSWKKNPWRPSGHLLLDKGRIYFKSAVDLAVFDSAKVDQLIANPPKSAAVNDAIQWRPVWRNAFEVDAATQMVQTIRKSWGGYGNRGGAKTSSGKPESIAEIQLFGDEIYQQMSIANGVLYAIEGKHFDTKVTGTRPQLRPAWNTTFRRTRSNYLTAYDAATGELKWTLPDQKQETNDNPTDDGGEPKWLEGGGFMSAPISFGELLLIPVNNGGSISIYALDPEQDGKTVWKSFLCDEPDSGAEAFAAINLTLDGSDLFVSCGMGVVFVLDPATGLVRFAKRYNRVGTPDDFRRRSGWTVNRLNFDGWSSDVVIPYGREMICFSSDTDSIEALDRNTGETIWRSEMSPIGYKVDYLLGVFDDVLYAAGRETIVAYDLKGEGRMIWGAEQMFDDKISRGRGMLTPDGIYMPVEDSIYHFSLPQEENEAKLLNRVQVNMGTEAPVGNLFSDGSRIWVHGANRLYALAPKSE